MVSVLIKFKNKDLSYTYEGFRDPLLDELIKELDECIEVKKDS